MSIRVTHSMIQRTALSDLARARSRLAQTQEQASSGLRVNRPSDDPVAARAATLLRAALAATEQYDRNATQTRARVEVTETALADSVDTLVRARELALQGANGTFDAVARREIAAEVEALHGRLLTHANARAASGHVFGGYSSDVAPFSAAGPFVTGSPSPLVSFVGDTGEIEIEIDEGVRVRATLNGQRVFLGDADGNASPDAGREDLFDVLGDLRDALVNDDPAAVAATLDRIDRGLEQLGVERTAIGAVDGQLRQWQDALARRKLELDGRLSDTEDADTAAVFSNLVTQEASLQASLQATARLLQPTLLEFLG